MTVKFKLKS